MSKALRTHFATVAADYRRSLNPKSRADANLVAAELALIDGSSRYFGLILPVVGLAIIVNFSDALPLWRLLAWWVPMSALFIGALILNRRVPVPAPGSPPDAIAFEAQRFTAIAAVLTVAWCGMVPALWIPDNSTNHIVLILIIASSMASCSTVNAPHFASGRICLTLYGLSLFGLPTLAQGSISPFFLAMALMFWVSMHINMRSNHETTCRMLSLQDERTALIADLRHAKIESDQARDRAEEASRAKSQFLANMSHELRTPLNAILGFSEMISSGTVTIKSDKSMEYAKFVHESGHHLLALINDVLDLSRIEAGALQLHESDIQTGLLIEDCVRLMTQKAQDKGVRLNCELDAPPAMLHADERALRQILLNLLSNALKFTPAGGTVTAFARGERDGSLTFGVRDTGIGIAEDDRLRVFEKFGQGRPDIAVNDKGTGLGLPIVRGLAEAHGGMVELASEVGEGTCVSVWLPARRCKHAPVKAAG